jgi:EAL domain-containing protein (putative c-di-GMP-specific phosphodiesterase class I)
VHLRRHYTTLTVSAISSLGEHLRDRVEVEVRATGLAPNHLRTEVTESFSVEMEPLSDQVLAHLESLGAEGAKLAARLRAAIAAHA